MYVRRNFIRHFRYTQTQKVYSMLASRCITAALDESQQVINDLVVW